MSNYAIIINGVCVAEYDDYEHALKESKGGIVIRSQDIEKYGYRHANEEELERLCK